MKTSERATYQRHSQHKISGGTSLKWLALVFYHCTIKRTFDCNCFNFNNFLFNGKPQFAEHMLIINNLFQQIFWGLSPETA